MCSEQRESGNTRKEQGRTLKIKEETNLIAMNESKQQTYYRRKNKSTPKGIITCQNCCCSFLTPWHTLGEKKKKKKGNSEIIRRALKLAFGV